MADDRSCLGLVVGVKAGGTTRASPPLSHRSCRRRPFDFWGAGKLGSAAMAPAVSAGKASTLSLTTNVGIACPRECADRISLKSVVRDEGKSVTKPVGGEVDKPSVRHWRVSGLLGLDGLGVSTLGLKARASAANIKAPRKGHGWGAGGASETLAEKSESRESTASAFSLGQEA